MIFLPKRLITRFISIESQPKKVVLVVVVVVVVVHVFAAVLLSRVVGPRNLTLKFGQNQVVIAKERLQKKNFI